MQPNEKLVRIIAEQMFRHSEDQSEARLKALLQAGLSACRQSNSQNPKHEIVRSMFAVLRGEDRHKAA